MCSKAVIFALFSLLFVSCYAGIDESCSNSNTNGKLTLHGLDENSKGFDVLCEQMVDGGGWTVILNRYDGSVNFHNRSWSDYKNGFGDLDAEFFLGLDKLNALTVSALHELEFVMVDYENHTHIANYRHVKVLDSTLLYAVGALGNYSGDAGDDFSADEFCSPDRYCKDGVPGWNKDKSDMEISFIFADHPYNVYMPMPLKNKKDKKDKEDKEDKDEEAKEEKEKKEKKDKKSKKDKDKKKDEDEEKKDDKEEEPPKEFEKIEPVEEDDEDDDEFDDDVMMARSATVANDNATVMCWRHKKGDKCEPLRALKMLVRPVNPYLHIPA